MSKSRPKRRLNKKAKRSIRRTTAAMLLITSIIVAAIPVPEVGAAEDTPPASASTLTYPTSFNDFTIPFDDTLITTLDPTGVSNSEKSYTVRQMSDGSWQLDWQFEFFRDTGKKGVVSKYNAIYQQNEVTLNPNVVTGYETVTEAQYADFYDTPATGQKEYKITYDDYIKKTVNDETTNFFLKYFEAAYNAYAKIWDAHKAAHDRWEALPIEQQTAQREPVLAEGDKELSKTPADLSTGENGTVNQKLQYYCDRNDFPGATLVRVYDDTGRTTADTTEGRAVVYMPRGGASAEGKLKDVNDFWYDDKKTASVIAIGDRAFAGTQNVHILHLADEIKYIGKEAFQDSFIQEVTFKNVETIGHRAFKDCSQLVKVELCEGTKIIGNEAFNATNISSIVFTYSVAQIGAGAFADCISLQTVDLSAISQVNSKLSEFAFYNDVALNTVNFGNSKINSIGKGCFAVASGVKGSLDTFAFPSMIATNDQLGDYMFAGRTNMRYVTMPSDFGRNSSVTIPTHMFEGCINLECIEFPADGGGSCGYVAYDSDLFANVINEGFYIRGPELDREGQKAKPRTSTWKAHTRVSEYVPYVYKKNNVDYWEVSKDSYLLLVDSKGNLASCTTVEGETLPRGFELIIPEQVGIIKVSAVAKGCFDGDPAIKENVGKVTIKDGSISRVDNAVFKGCPLLKEAYVGDTVNEIGSEAFADCPQLTDITFNSPADGNYKTFKIGADALTTGSNKLTVHADVVDGYAPFTWAMNPANYVDKITGTRVCYRGLAPKYMTAIIDNETNLPTLVDYPKYDRVDMENQDYIEQLAFYYVNKYGTQTQTGGGGTTTDPDTPGGGGTGTDPSGGGSGAGGGGTGGETTDPETGGGTGGTGGGGTSTPDTPETGAETARALTAAVQEELYASLDNSILLASLDDDESEDPGGDIGSVSSYVSPDPREYHIDNYKQFAEKYSIIGKYEAYVVNKQPASYEWETMTPRELDIINATRELVVPSGIKSLDARGFFADSSGANTNNIIAYFKTTDINYQMCQPGQGAVKDEVEPGIFSGYYKDYDTAKEPEDAALYEKQVKGNDRVESITLTSIEKLPDYAFDSCERLHTVILGDACKDIGTAPFRGCTNLVNVVGNQYYASENGIIYSRKADGTLQIEECLAARGSTGANTVGTKYINSETDPLLANVSSIAEGAFQNCDYISKVDLSVMEKVKSIPKACFNGCDGLSDVSLPVTVNEIQEEAFSDTPTGLSVTIPGREVSIEDTAFDHNEGTIRTYEDSAAYTYARYHNIDIELLSEKHKVTFLDYDGTELDIQYVEDGGTAVAPDVPKRKGYEFTGWSDDFKGVTKDIWLIAQYKTDASNPNGGSSGNNSGGSNGSGSSSGGSDKDSESSGIHTVTVINGTGSGTYKKGETVTITANGPSLGQKFDKWITSSLNVAMANVTSASTTFTMPDNSVVVTATFKSDGTKPITGGSSSTLSGNGTSTANSNGTTVRINKSGISNTNLASAVVHGSSDKFMVVITDSAEAVAAVEAALQAQYGERFPALRYTAMDISLYDATGTAKIENTQGITVDITIPIPDILIQYGGSNRAISVSNGALEHLNTRFTSIDGVPCMTFTATHFSPYGVYTDTENLTASMDMTPKTGDGIHPKWFLSVGLMCASIVLFLKKDEKKRRVRTA